MIFYLNGILKIKDTDFVVIDVQGVGYQVFVPANSPLYLLEEGDPVKTYTYQQVKEDDLRLFGFDSRAELNLFQKLITVNSVGAKGAVALLSSMAMEDLKKAIIFEDVTALTRANGIGKKTAQKIVLELKDKLGAPLEGDGLSMSSGASPVSRPDESVAVEALVNLGYGQGEASLAVGSILKNHPEEKLPVEEIIKQALKEI